jgi:Ca2+-binding RTX toxin-like protein
MSSSHAAETTLFEAGAGGMSSAQAVVMTRSMRANVTTASLAGEAWTIFRGAMGADRLFGEEGRDQLFGGSENDTLSGGSGTDEGFGGSGTDTCLSIEFAHGC